MESLTKFVAKLEMLERKNDWENIYQIKSFIGVRGYGQKREIFLAFLKLKVILGAKIIDSGGGERYFVDYLLALGFQNITMVNQSPEAQ